MAVTYCEKCGITVGLPHRDCKGVKMKKQTLYAFWNYDLCPYVLGGIVTEFTESGKVRVKGYDGMAFKPIAIIPDQKGADALKLVKELRSKYDQEEKELKAKYKNMTRGIIGLED